MWVSHSASVEREPGGASPRGAEAALAARRNRVSDLEDHRFTRAARHLLPLQII